MVNILFCGNGYVFDGMLTCALSILKRSESTEPYTFKGLQVRLAP